jgi:hypothetical protein
MRAAPRQYVVDAALERKGPLEGWAASGIVGTDHARWIPLLEARDRYDRPRGAAAAMLMNYRGFYRGSSWAFVGVDNVDLFADETGPLADALRQTARFLLRETYLHNLTTDQRLYHDGETVRVSVEIANHGVSPQRAAVRFLVGASPFDGRKAPKTIHEAQVQVEPGVDRKVEATFAPGAFSADLYQVGCELSLDGRPVDRMETGFVVRRPDVVRSAAASRFVANYFTRGNRPVFLFGSDTYSVTYTSAFENPLTWHRELSAARDIGLQVYENLQYHRPGHLLEDSDWRAFHAMAQLTQKHNLVFMPGMLIGHNVAIDADELAEQSALCEAYAAALRETPALHYYINGDYRLEPGKTPEATRALWNAWLAERYGTAQAWKQAWGTSAHGEFGALPFPPPNSGLWDEVSELDRSRFQIWLTTRWNAAHVAAVRGHDTAHPIMSEYYQRPFGGLDLRLTIDGQDVSDFGYFDEPVVDIDKLPLAIRFNDLRTRGKGVTMGEYGVKTHPAWTVENGATHYHIRRSEEEQKQLFLAVGHYALGMGVSKIQNWCLADAQDRVFPWGLFYPHQPLPKDVAYVHRNQSVIWRFFAPRYVPAPLTVCLASDLRLGNREQLGLEIAYRTFADLLAEHYDFNVVDDLHLDALPAETKLMLYPSPFAVRNDVYARLVEWVRKGGTLLLTGDLSYDADRRPSRRDRLRELCGVEFVRTQYDDMQRTTATDLTARFKFASLPSMPLRPCVESRPITAQVLGSTEGGNPVLTRHRIGDGTVYWLADPLELDGEREAVNRRRAIYRAILDSAGIPRLGIRPDVPWLHVVTQPTTSGKIHIVYNTRMENGHQRVRLTTTAGEVTFDVRDRGPAFVAVTDDGRVVAANAYGEASVGDDKLLSGRGLKAALTLDGCDLRESRAILIGPFQTGTLEVAQRVSGWLACLGEFRGGRWVTLEEIQLDHRAGGLVIDEDRATCMILLCHPDMRERCVDALSTAMMHPERLTGF